MINSFSHLVRYYILLLTAINYLPLQDWWKNILVRSFLCSSPAIAVAGILGVILLSHANLETA